MAMLFPTIMPFFAAATLCHRRCRFCSDNRFIFRSRLSTQTMASFMSKPQHPRLLHDTQLESQPNHLHPQAHRKEAYGLSDIIKYLDRIEYILKSPTSESPALKYQHCYANNNDGTFFKVIGSVLSKPMLRTLIYGDINVNEETSENAETKKIHFDRRLREARVRIEGQRMCSFVLNSLRPAALELDSDLQDEMVPDLIQQIDNLERRMNRDKSSPIILTTGSSAIFSRLASGRYYKGKLRDMISDLFPDLLEEYQQATQKATEREMLAFVIQHDLSSRISVDSEEDDGALIEQRINAAYKCLDRFYPIDTDPSDQSQPSESGIQSGKMCEDSCIEFLTSEHHSDTRKRIVLQNVYVNSRRSKDSSKYVPPKISRNGQSDPKYKLDGTGIIWSDNTDGGAGRHRLCSEFDAVVLSEVSSADTDAPDFQPTETTKIRKICSIWEAKKTISPSTLHDILSKKLGAIQTLMDDPTAELVYGDFATETIPFAADEGKFTFGVYGTELQKAEHASDSIRSIAASYVVSSDIREIIRALDRVEIVDSVLVEVELESALSIVSSLRALVEEIQKRDGVEVLMILEKPI